MFSFPFQQNTSEVNGEKEKEVKLVLLLFNISLLHELSPLGFDTCMYAPGA